MSAEPDGWVPGPAPGMWVHRTKRAVAYHLWPDDMHIARAEGTWLPEKFATLEEACAAAEAACTEAPITGDHEG